MTNYTVESLGGGRDRLITRTEACALLHWSIGRFRSAVRDGLIAPQRIDGHDYYYRSEVRRLIKK